MLPWCKPADDADAPQLLADLGHGEVELYGPCKDASTFLGQEANLEVRLLDGRPNVPHWCHLEVKFPLPRACLRLGEILVNPVVYQYVFAEAPVTPLGVACHAWPIVLSTHGWNEFLWALPIGTEEEIELERSDINFV